MVSVQDAKNDVYNFLIGLGYSPTNLIITEFNTETDDDSWKLVGEFRGGFMAEFLKFEIKYFSENRSLGSCKISPGTSQEGFA